MKTGTILLIGGGLVAAGAIYLYTKGKAADPTVPTPNADPPPATFKCPTGYATVKDAKGNYTCKRVTLAQAIINTVAKIDPKTNGAVNGFSL
jgi:hypothetical protein